MDNKCGNSAVRFCSAMFDPNLLGDPRVLMNLLAHERRQRAENQTRECRQTDITLEMRKNLAHWMLQVCELRLCEEEVFPLAMSYVRICLSSFPLHRDHLKLLGSTCLLLASKMRNKVQLHISILEYYTGGSVTCHQIREWEPFILNILHWDLEVIISHNFLDHMLERVFCSLEMRASLRKNAGSYATLCYTDCNLSKFAPSTITGVCISKAMQDFGFVVSPAEDLYTFLSALTDTTTDEFLACQAEMDSSLYVQMQ
ncbi:G1/S-specific cyclin-D3 [Rhinoderma darwinii]|uniref:G1/S-specific cyclin-D3 n=1 Tax=Rhinoderma darwinii TaxID=43563 RepID=UPI003F662147